MQLLCTLVTKQCDWTVGIQDLHLQRKNKYVKVSLLAAISYNLKGTLHKYSRGYVSSHRKFRFTSGDWKRYMHLSVAWHPEVFTCFQYGNCISLRLSLFLHNFSGMKQMCRTTRSWRCCLTSEIVSSIPDWSTIICWFLCGFICVSLCQSIKIIQKWHTWQFLKRFHLVKYHTWVQCNKCRKFSFYEMLLYMYYRHI